ncbi:MAG: uroporphyrinogen decarboxylase family protein [Candidatus Latescibacterota bacterium]
MVTPKRRMLNAYRGLFSDRYPVAPEFWYYYPAQVMGVGMVEFQREIPLWQALQTTFRKYGTEGWGVAFPSIRNPDLETAIAFERISDRQYRETRKNRYRGREFVSTARYDVEEPFWSETHAVSDRKDLDAWVDMALSPKNVCDFSGVNEAHRGVGEDYLLEFWLGTPFFDFIAGAMGFESAALFFMSENDGVLTSCLNRYIEYQKALIAQVCEQTPYESFAIGCSFSCNSLIGPLMWRRWDKPYIHAMTEEAHKWGKLLHVHFHGKSLETVADFAEIGMDCVCPFERSPGGDINGAEGLRAVRELLRDRVTFNGNVHTVETLIRGNPEDVRREVREIKEAFAGSPRLIIGTGDQVGRETPEENILAMVEEAKRG